MCDFGYIKKNYDSLTEEISDLAARIGAPAAKLICVTKSGSDEELCALVRAGASAIGENRPQELFRRGALLQSAGLSAELHEIGTLQRNKVKLVVPTAEMIHSVDSLKLCEDISRHSVKNNVITKILIEINSGREPNKSGVMPEDAEALLYQISNLQGIAIKGLMTMGPVCNGEEIRPYFRLTKELFDRLNQSYGFGEGATLSMGMSDSYRTAIEEGSTLVRVGRKLFIK